MTSDEIAAALQAVIKGNTRISEREACSGFEQWALNGKTWSDDSKPITVPAVLRWCIQGSLLALGAGCGSDGCAQLDDLCEKLLRKYEVQKRLMSAYSPVSWRAVSRDEISGDDYVLLGAVFLLTFLRTHDIRFLNATLKIVDGENEERGWAAHLYALIKAECIRCAEAL